MPIAMNTPMGWSFDHPIMVSAGVVSLAVVLVLLVFGIAPHVLRDSKTGPQLASSMASIVIAVLIGVFLNNVLQGGRAREARLASIRDQHLNQLRPVLKAESQSLQGLANAMLRGHLADLNSNPVNDARNIEQRIWPEPMSADLGNHFTEYDDGKKALSTDAKQQDEEFRATVSALVNSIPDKQLPNDSKENASVSFVQKCIGASRGMVLNRYPGNPGSYSFLGEDGSVSSGGGNPPPDEVSALAAYDKLKPNPQILAHCDSLKSRAANIEARANDLSREALVLSEGTVMLTGDCQFLKIE